MSEQRAWMIWLTGLPASGKTTLAYALRRRLSECSVPVAILDSDEVRHMLTPEATYTTQDRDSFYRRIVDLAALLVRSGANTIIAATANRRAYRRLARDLLVPFAEIWVRCPVDVCRQRDPKQLYEQAARGRINGLPGAGEVYEPPDAPELIVDTGYQSIEESVDQIISNIPFLRAAVIQSYCL